MREVEVNGNTIHDSRLTIHVLRFTMNKDIATAEDIRHLIDTFYSKVRLDDTIGYIFNDIAKVDWQLHLPKMYSFWEFLLLGKDGYLGNPLEAHHRLNQKIKLTSAHFDRWVQIFSQTVDDNYAGLNAEEAKNKARLIAMTWIPKLTE